MKRNEARMYKVLFSIVREYIRTKKPVSSKRVLEVTDLAWSGATVRNDMRHLEELGYIYQPHTSAGRIPTDKGLRFYLDEMLKMRAEWKEEDLGIEVSQRFPFGDLETILDALARILSRAAKGLVLITKPSLESLKLLKVYVTPVGEDHVVISAITELGLSKVIPVSRVRGMNMKALENFFELFTGMSIKRITENLKAVKPSSAELEIALELAKGVLKFLTSGEKIIYRGIYHLLRENSQSVEGLVRLIESSKPLEQLFESVKESTEVFIGRENPIEELRPFSTFVSPYFKGKDLVGYITLIASKYISYEEVYPLVEFISNRLTEYLTVTARG